MLRSLAILLACVLATGCASITGSKNQPISITAVCDARPANDIGCTLMNDKGTWFLQTPGSVMIQKSYGDLSVSCKRGESVASATFQSKSNGGVWGNILAGGIIGYAVDANSGAGFDYPSVLTIAMPPPCADDTAVKDAKREKPAGTNAAALEKLEALKRLREKNLITEEEYQEKRKPLLEQL